MRVESCISDRSPRDDAGAELVPGFYFPGDAQSFARKQMTTLPALRRPYQPGPIASSSQQALEVAELPAKQLKIMMAYGGRNLLP